MSASERQKTPYYIWVATRCPSTSSTLSYDGSQFYHPLFNWDRSEICFALVTIFIALAGSIGIAKMMEKTHLAYLFGKGKMLR